MHYHVRHRSQWECSNPFCPVFDVPNLLEQSKARQENPTMPTDKMKHTPGPWTIQGEYVEALDLNGAPRSICTLAKNGAQTPFNAAVLSAAPDLLAACNLLRAAVDSAVGEVAGRNTADWGLINDALLESAAAIAKAEGGAR